jgi:GPH family glycoside/pentoside/hexuronide:cation symporter
METALKKERVPTSRIFGYALGEGALSITMNGISNFAMLYYTKVLGLDAVYAGIALAVALFWDAIADPVIGHITDNTRTRYGRRHPYLIFGGIALTISFYLLWILPDQFSNPAAIFWCVLVINLVVRTAIAVFSIPYMALGFEMCPDYEDRSRLQGIRFFFNQVVNLVFGALAWSLFFSDRVATDGSTTDGTLIGSNYLTMAWVLSLFTLVLVGFCVFATWSFARDNRHMSVEDNTPKAFLRDFMGICSDRLGWYVFGFFSFATLGMMLTSQVQMFAYVDYMKFSATEKTAVHGAGMLSFALGSLFQAWLTGKMGKKPAAYIGMACCVAGGLFLYIVFMGGLIKPGSSMPVGQWTLPVAAVVFGLGQSLWWGGCGILGPLANSLVADLSEIHFHRTGVLRDGSYSALFMFFCKACMGIGLLITGQLLKSAGIVSGAETQTAKATYNIAMMTFLSGPVLIILSFFVLWKYPVDRAYLERLRKKEV